MQGHSRCRCVARRAARAPSSCRPALRLLQRRRPRSCAAPRWRGSARHRHRRRRGAPCQRACASACRLRLAACSCACGACARGRYARLGVRRGFGSLQVTKCARSSFGGLLRVWLCAARGVHALLPAASAACRRRTRTSVGHAHAQSAGSTVLSLHVRPYTHGCHDQRFPARGCGHQAEGEGAGQEGGVFGARRAQKPSVASAHQLTRLSAGRRQEQVAEQGGGRLRRVQGALRVV